MVQDQFVRESMNQRQVLSAVCFYIQPFGYILLCQYNRHVIYTDTPEHWIGTYSYYCEACCNLASEWILPEIVDPCQGKGPFFVLHIDQVMYILSQK